MSDNAIEINKLTKYYGDIRGIENISFSVKKGEVHGFLGPNGAGKTTTIRILVGLLNASSGSATLLGENAGTVAAKKLIGYLPSDFGLYDFYTVTEYLDYLEQLRGNAPYRDELVERFGVEIGKKTSELSRGNRQKVAIVQALMHDPEILIADEPTTGLDPLLQAEFNNYLEEYIDRGGTAFISSHILAEVQDICEKVTVIRNGEIAESGRVGELLAKMPRKAILKTGKEVDPDKIAERLDARLGDVFSDRFVIYFDYSAKEFVSKLNGLDIQEFSLPEPSLEEYFLPLYEKGEV